MVLRTFSKIYGLAGLRIGYAIAPARVITAIGKVRRAFDVTTPAQEAALASLDDGGELARRRDANQRGRAGDRGGAAGERLRAGRAGDGQLRVCRDGRGRARPLFEALLREGVIVRPTGGFGAPGAIRVTVGTADENAFFAEALAAAPSIVAGVRPSAPRPSIDSTWNRAAGLRRQQGSAR